jgi:hypothetical protein
MKMIMEHWWNDTGRRNTEIFEKELFPAPLGPLQISHGQNLNLTRGATQAIDRQIYGTASCHKVKF